MRNRIIMICVACLTACLHLWAGQLPDYLYEEWRKSPFPAGGITVSANPVSLLWPSAKYWEKRDVSYNVYLSRDASFPENGTCRSMNQKYCFFNPHRRLEPGKWYWKYEEVEGGKVIPKGMFSFVVAAGTEGVVTPCFEEFAGNIPQTHPRVMNYGRDMQEIRAAAPSHPLYKQVIRIAVKVMEAGIYRGAVTDDNPAKARRLNQIAVKEVEAYRSLLEGYALSGRDDMLRALLERTQVLLTWPTDDLLGSRVLAALSMGYDMLYAELDEKTRAQILSVVDRQLKNGLGRWPGYTEARQVENHFWQMEIAGNFTAALATLHHLESAEEMLRYTYGLFIARFPNLATQDGGWAEGEGYYSVNESAVVNMALLLKTIGKIDLFRMGWYRNLPDYFTYFSPVAAPTSGFGDMHERVESGSLKGRSEMLALGCEEGDSLAVYRLFSSLKPVGSFYGEPLPSGHWKKALAKIEPWYQIANDIRLSEKDVRVPRALPHDKVFLGVGVAAMHTQVLEPGKNTTVFFRSSPFGAKGHMHANQNSFNISRKGERLFYSTGYYTSFADPHSLTSYRHTRAHNTILLNGYGQAFGHEGYGWIKRHLEGGALSYVCGDASHAYRKVTDGQFLGLMEKNGIAQDAHFGMGDSGMRQYERHIVFARPDIVVVYDVLEAADEAEWSLLLHTVSPSRIVDDGALVLDTERSHAVANVYGSTPVDASLTDRFFSPAVDFKKKFPKGTPPEYHATFKNKQKKKRMRFLTVIRMSDRGAAAVPLKACGKGRWEAGGVSIEAELDGDKPAVAVVRHAGAVLRITPSETVLEEAGKRESCGNLKPSGNYVF